MFPQQTVRESGSAWETLVCTHEDVSLAPYNQHKPNMTTHICNPRAFKVRWEARDRGNCKISVSLPGTWHLWLHFAATSYGSFRPYYFIPKLSMTLYHILNAKEDLSCMHVVSYGCTQKPWRLSSRGQGHSNPWEPMTLLFPPARSQGHIIYPED